MHFDISNNLFSISPIETVALPIESYALKAIANWLGFTWRDPKANGAKCIYWYDQWLETGDREFLKMIQVYNEDDCYATRRVKDWLVSFLVKKNLIKNEDADSESASTQ
ncbi:TM0106 family RecB-like putative nuclease [Cylindrospermopsis raciborskii]|uniref:TM0106 family RecB-like putative nuclease n=1 Tax=Cylindrospermopsis raciborskii TaxID=77022 RepID=UPI0009EE7ABE|nr:TM0106 family RecB-like putative nuclease [Cylindrospermopsis raciborskii]MCZ2205222.1 TM0106 family RecB-like putative nuclease [Cylindrospermopsis raciborskii PAMP2011]